MTNETRRPVVKSTAAAALLDSMHIVRQALTKPDGISPEQLRQRIHEWQIMMVELIGGTVKGAELNTLYEIIGVLNSSLDLTKTLSLVMESLINLTGAERGCLMLVDEEGNLEIRAAQNFQEDVETFDRELSHTVVREAVERGQPVLTTNAQLDPRFSDQESVIGYQLRSIVCVPMHVRERVTGALYLDNRMRDNVFSQEDLPILTAFASQAAVAIENARLYTLTDQALTARLEELTALQNIDRELNASLEMARVLDLTLSWALRAIGAKRGTLTTLRPDGTIEAVARNSDEQMTAPEEAVIKQAIENQDPCVLGGSRLLVPIRYEDRTVALLDLRSRREDPFRQDHVQFASRLADHAAVAIENARLYEEIRQANRAKSDFISFVAHELRTPMTSIRGYADMLSKGMVGPLSPDQVKFIKTIMRNAERMQILVSDLQDISKIESRQMRLELKTTSVSDALEEAESQVQDRLDTRSQQLTIDISDDLPQIQADPTRLTQVFVELLDNASKYTPPTGQIQIQAQIEADDILCTVSDTGIGISPEDQTQLFTKFFRSDNPMVREMPGTGLGLCVVKGLVELWGGEFNVESEPGEGTAVTFRVPIATADAESAQDSA